MRDRERTQHPLAGELCAAGRPCASAASLSRACRAAPRPGLEPPRGKRQRRRPVLRRVLLGVSSLFWPRASAWGLSVCFYAQRLLWLDLEQLPHWEATILYAQDRETGEWVEYARLEATQQKIWVRLGDLLRTCSTHLGPLRTTSILRASRRFPTRTAYAVPNEMKRRLHRNLFRQRHQAGAPTIDQQLIKNLTRDDEAGGLEGYMRKVREIWRAYRLDAKYDKGDHPGGIPQRHKPLPTTRRVWRPESIKLFGKIRQGLISGPVRPPSPPSPKPLTGTTRAPMKKSI